MQTPAFDPPHRLQLTSAQRDAIVEHCIAGYPDEACGLLSGPFDGRDATGEVTGVHPARNVDASARSYTVESRDLLAAMRAAEHAGGDLIGVWHSHTHTEPYPSTTDIRQAFEPSWCYVLVGLSTAPPELRAYRIMSGTVTEIPVEIRADAGA